MHARTNLALPCALGAASIFACLSAHAFAQTLQPYPSAPLTQNAKPLKKSMGSRSDSAQKDKASRPDDYSPAATEAGTLPQNIFRARVLSKSIFAKKGFSADGSADSTGIHVAVSAVAFVLDAGLGDNLTFALGIPYVYANKSSFDGAQFVASKLFQSNYEKYKKDFIKRLVAQGECASEDSCQQRIDRGDSLPVDVDFRIPSTNEKVTIPAFMPIQDALTSLIVHAAKQGDGAKGLGDIEGGVRYRFKTFTPTNPIQMAVTLGLAAPTGAFSAVPQAQRATGRGVFEASLTLAGDVRVRQGFMVSASYGLGGSPAGAEKKRPGLRDNTAFVDGQCEETGQGNNADGQCKPLSPTQSLVREGLTHKALMQASLGLGALSRSLRLFAITGGARYEHDSIEVIDGEAGPQKSLTTLAVTLSVDGLAKKPLFPMQLDFEYVRPISGAHQPLALESLTTTLKLFF